MESARYQLMLLTRLKHNEILERHKASLRSIGDFEDCEELISLHLDALRSVPTDGILLSLYPVESFFRRRNSVNELGCVEVPVRFDQSLPSTRSSYTHLTPSVPSEACLSNVLLHLLNSFSAG